MDNALFERKAYRMKISLPLLLILGSLVCFCSCTKTLHTRQVLQSCRTKDDVLKQFGPPNEIKPGEGIDEWVYNRNSASTINKPNKQDTVNDNNVSASYDSLKVDQGNHNASYFKFIIDTNNNVVGYKNNGVDLTKKVKQNPVLASLNFLFEVVVVTVVVGLYLGVENYINW